MLIVVPQPLSPVAEVDRVPPLMLMVRTQLLPLYPSALVTVVTTVPPALIVSGPASVPLSTLL